MAARFNIHHPSPCSPLVKSHTSFLFREDLEGGGIVSGDGGRGCEHRVDQADLRQMRLRRTCGETMWGSLCSLLPQGSSLGSWRHTQLSCVDRDESPPGGVYGEEMSETLQCTLGPWPWAQVERRSGPWVSPARGIRAQR